MTYLSFLVLLFLASVGAATVALYFRPHLVNALLPAVGTILLIVLLPAKTRIPAEVLVRPGEIGTLPSWSWQMSNAAWWLNFSLLLLVIAAGLTQWARPSQTTSPLLSVTLSLLLVSSTLIATIAVSWPALLSAWVLLAGVWFLLLNLNANSSGKSTVALGPLFFLGAGPLLLWLALLTLPQASGTTGLDVRAWPTLTRSLLLLAALLQLGAFPFHFWRPLSRRWQRRSPQILPLSTVLAHTAPVIAGAALLARLEAATDISLAFALPLTLAGLFGLLWAANTAWRFSDDRMRLAGALALGQASLVLLASTWAGPEAILAEARTFLLANGLLLLVARRDDIDLLAALAAMLAVAALAGLPLTTGFTGRTALYDVWLSNGRWLLLLVTALLHIPFIAATLLLLRSGVATGWRKWPDTRREIAGSAGLLLPALGLLGFSGLGTASFTTWLAVLLPTAAALLVIYFLEETEAVQQMVEEALSLPFAPRPIFDPLRRGIRHLIAGLAEAATILEGERGLLWLLFILFIIWFVR